MIDSHCHLADEAFASDAAEVIRRAEEAGLAGALCILDATSEEEQARAERLLARWPGLCVALGVHPHRAGAAAPAERVAEVVGAAIGHQAAACAVGEVGLDYHYDFAPRDVQQAVFRSQVRLARELDLPVVIHTREAMADTLRILADEGRGAVRGVFHCFTGDRAEAAAALDLGFHLSFSGILTFPRAGELRAVAAEVPGHRYLVETDSPYLAPVPYRGRRNEPAFVARVVEALAGARGTTAAAVAAESAAAFAALFGRGDRPAGARATPAPA